MTCQGCGAEIPDNAINCPRCDRPVHSALGETRLGGLSDALGATRLHASREEMPMARIVIRHLTGSKANETEEFPLHDFTELTIGRDPASKIQYDASRDDLVSRNHAKIVRDGKEGGQFFITDLGSSNGTYVDTEKINGPTRLAHGSRIQLGMNGPEFRFELDPPPQTSLLTRLGQVDSPESRTDILPPLTGPGRTSRRTGFTSVSEGAGRGVGAGTVARMIDERLVATTQRSRNTLINSIAAGLGVVVLAAGIFVYLQRTLRTHDPKADSLSQNSIPEPIQDVQSPPMESMSASQIVNIYGSATVYFEVTWKLVSASTGEPVYQRYIDGSPAYKYNPKGIAEPWLTRYKQESARNPVAIGQGLRGSGFVVEKSGFILTCRHLVEPWNFPVSLPDGYIYDPKDLKKRLSPITNQEWIPAQTQQRDVPDVQGRLEHARVAFAKSEVSIPAQVIRTSNKSDVALVKVDVPQLLRTVDWDVSYTKIQAGDPITILGYPGNSPDLVEGVHVPTVITGVIGKVIREERDQKDFISFICRTCMPTDFFQLTANIGSGGSGGPVFDQRGKVIAIYFARRRTSDGAQVTYALPIKYGTDLMEINPLVGKD